MTNRFTRARSICGSCSGKSGTLSAEGDAAAARSAASAAESDAAAARGAADQAEADATKANDAADSAQKHADAVAEAAQHARDSAVQAQQAADRAEEAARKAEEANRKEQADGLNGETPPGMSDDEKFYLWSEGGDDLVNEFQDSLKAASEGILDFIKQNGADVLLEIIGVKDAQRCFGEGDIVSCLWTVVNAASLIALIAKIPAVASAIAKITGGVAKFLEATAVGQKFLELARSKIGQGLARCAEGFAALRAAAANCLTVLKDYATKYFNFDGTAAFKLQKNDMDHILRGHHPDYFDPASRVGKQKSDLFPPEIHSIEDVQEAVHVILEQNKGKLDVTKWGDVTGIYKGRVYKVGWQTGGRIGQFTPVT